MFTLSQQSDAAPQHVQRSMRRDCKTDPDFQESHTRRIWCAQTRRLYRHREQAGCHWLRHGIANRMGNRTSIGVASEAQPDTESAVEYDASSTIQNTAPMAATDIPQKTMDLYERLVGTIPGVDRKGKAMPYTSQNGHMFSFLTNDGRLALRLSDDERDTFLKTYRTRLVKQHGRVMKEYVSVPVALLKRTKELSKWFQVSYDYVSSLKPKPTTRKKKQKKKASGNPGSRAAKASTNNSAAKKKAATKKSATGRMTASKKKTGRKKAARASPRKKKKN